MKQLIPLSFIIFNFIFTRTNAVLNDLHLATSCDNVAVAVRMLDNPGLIRCQRDALLNAQDKQGKTPIHWAVINGAYKMLKEMLRYRPRQDIFDVNGLLPIHYAAVMQNIEACNELLAHGATVNDVTVNGESPLILSLLHRRPTTAVYFIGHGADINIIPLNGRPAIYWANFLRYYGIVRLLLAKGACDRADGLKIPIPDVCRQIPLLRPVPQYAVQRLICNGDSVIIKIPSVCFF